MAYMTKEGEGPYPNKAGEYCGNHLPGSHIYCHMDETSQQAEERRERHLARMRFGQPRGCKSGTSEEMKAKGWVGLYLKEDSNLSSGDVEIPTPPELMEPVGA